MSVRRRGGGVPAGPMAPVVRRSRWLVLIAAFGSALAVGGLLLGGWVHSPWESAAANATAVVTVTVPVEHRDFTPDEITAEGTATLGATRDVVPTVDSGAVAVVTGVGVRRGGMLRPGQSLVEVSGRPLVALRLPFDLYRDIVPGNSGPDVRALQGALRALGLYRGALDGTYGSGTSAAMRALYARAGAEPPAPDSAAQATMDEARRALAAAVSPMSTDAGTPSTDEISSENEKALRATLHKAEMAAETPVRRAEIIALTSGGARVVSVKPVGTRLDGGEVAVARLRSGTPRATVRVGVADADSFTVGTGVEVSSMVDRSVVVKAQVTGVSDFSASDADGSVPGYDVTLAFDDTRDVPLADGAKVDARVASDDTPLASLAVPLVAVREDDAGTFVLVAGTTSRRVSVTVTTTSDGYAAVDSDLRVGDRVVVTGQS